MPNQERREKEDALAARKGWRYNLGFSGDLKLPHAPKLVEAALQQFRGRKRTELFESAGEDRIEELGGGFVVQLRAPFGLRHNLVDDAEFGQIAGSNAQRIGGQFSPWQNRAKRIDAHPSGEMTE